MLAVKVLLGVMSITAYQATPAQTKPECTDNWHCYTSIDEPVSPTGCAVSQDLLKSGRVKYREWLYVDGYGYCFVNDTMNKRHTNSVDVFAWTPEDEHRVQPYKAKVYLLRQKRRSYDKETFEVGRSGTSVSGVCSTHSRNKKNPIR